MKKSFVFAIAPVLFAFASYGQVTAIPSNIRAANLLQTMDGAIRDHEILFGIPLPPKEVIGDPYLELQWRSSSFLLYKDNTVLSKYPAKYDLREDQFEVKTSQGIKVLQGKQVKSFTWPDSVTNSPVYFVNTRDFKGMEDEQPGFFEIRVDGRLPLLKKTEVAVLRANYNVQLNVGDRDDKIVKKPAYFFSKDGVAYKIPSSRRKFLGLLAEHGPKAGDIVESNNLKLTQEADLEVLFRELNR